jgi:hypothetical protein
LLEKGADANAQKPDMWTLSHEAVSLGNPEFLATVLKFRDYQRVIKATESLVELKNSLKNSEDFYVEMGWEFTSWLPMVKNYCPSDTYKIYKNDSCIRIDATLLGYEEGCSWRRGNQSFIFRFSDDRVEVIFVDHGQRAAYIQNIDLKSSPALDDFAPAEDVISEKLSTPITTTGVNIDAVGFERSKSFGILSFLSSDKHEEVEGYDCRVYNASNLKVITKTRAEHLCEEDKWRNTNNFADNKPISFLMGLFEKKRTTNGDKTKGSNVTTSAEYFDPNYPSDSLSIGRAREEVERQNAFNASLCLAENYPLKLEDQIFPVIDLMAIRNANFSRLKSFVQLQLPAGFPVRISIPLFHMINARITFRNVNNPSDLSGITSDSDIGFLVDAAVFEIPDGYAKYSTTSSLLFDQLDQTSDSTVSGQSEHHAHRYGAADVDDEYVMLLERFMGEDGEGSPYDRQMQSVIEASMRSSAEEGQIVAMELDEEDDIAKAIRLSQMEEEQRKRDREAEEEEIRMALELSKVEH